MSKQLIKEINWVRWPEAWPPLLGNRRGKGLEEVPPLLGNGGGTRASRYVWRRRLRRNNGAER